MAVATLSFLCKFYEITLIVPKPGCPGTSSLLLLCLPCSSRQHLQRDSYQAKLLLGQFGEIRAAVCSQNSSIAGESTEPSVQAPCAITLGYVLSSALHLKMSSCWNKLVVLRNYCNNPRRNHKLQTWNSDCFHLNTKKNRSILRLLALVKLLSQFMFTTVLWEPLKPHV